MPVQFKCPGCGSVLVFDAASQKLKCNSCDYQKDVPDFEKKTFDEFEGENAVSFSCTSCGATLITDAHTSATFCKFCGSPTLIASRLTNEAAPSGVVPFKITKEQATELFRGWCQKGMFTPGFLKSSSTIEKMTGMYVPFWLYNYNAQSDMDAHCTRSTHSREGDYEVTRTAHYDVKRVVNADFEMIPADASENMEDNMMDKLEPFNYDYLVPFEMPYLSGFYAEKFNFRAEEMYDRVQKRVDKYITDIARDSIKGYDTVSIERNMINEKCTSTEYVLMPVWTLTYRWKGQNKMFTINGQSGKIVADRPVSGGRIAAIAGIVLFGCFTLISLIGGMIL